MSGGLWTGFDNLRCQDVLAVCFSYVLLLVGYVFEVFRVSTPFRLRFAMSPEWLRGASEDKVRVRPLLRVPGFVFCLALARPLSMLMFVKGISISNVYRLLKVRTISCLFGSPGFGVRRRLGY